MRGKKEPPKKIETLNLSELNELWPKSDDGRLCARLLQRYGFTLLVESAIGAAGTIERAQAETGASKAIAKIVKDFGSLTTEKPVATPRKPLAPLHRFAPAQPEKPEKK